MVKFLLFCLVFLGSIGIMAYEKPIQEFTALEVFYRFSNSPHPEPSHMLRKNVESAIAFTLSKREDGIRDLKSKLESAEIQFEKVEGTQIVYALYGDYVFQFYYAGDPTKFHLSPVEYKIWRKPADLKKSAQLNSSKEE